MRSVLHSPKSAVFACLIRLTAAFSVPAAADKIVSNAEASGCITAAYPSRDCEFSQDEFNGPASIAFSLGGGTVSAFAVPGANKSFLNAYALSPVNGEQIVLAAGYANANSGIYYTVVNKSSGKVDRKAVVSVQVAGFANVGTPDPNDTYQSASADWSFCVGPSRYSPEGCSYAQASGYWTLGSAGGKGSSFSDNFKNVTATFNSTPYWHGVLTFQTKGVFFVGEQADAVFNGVGGVDPIFTPADPNDVLIGPPFNSDPNTPLFTQDQLNEFASFGITTGGIPMSPAVPEPSTRVLLLAGLAALASAAPFRKSAYSSKLRRRLQRSE